MDLVYPPDRDQAKSVWYGTLLQGRSAYFEIRMKKPRPLLPTSAFYSSCDLTPAHALNLGFDDEDFLWIIAACAPIMDDASNVVCICGSATDISVGNLSWGHHKPRLPMILGSKAGSNRSYEAKRDT